MTAHPVPGTGWTAAMRSTSRSGEWYDTTAGRPDATALRRIGDWSRGPRVVRPVSRTRPVLSVTVTALVSRAGAAMARGAMAAIEIVACTHPTLSPAEPMTASVTRT